MHRLRILGLALSGVLGCGSRSGMKIDAPPPDAPALDTPRVSPAPDAPPVCRRVVTVGFWPTVRLQLAVWAETPEDFATIRLTEATAYRGLGNRPGALQMPSGFRWPVGRRENVLPGWAGARLAHGEEPFPRVIFRERPEGFLSGTGSGARDDYYCLSFDADASRRDGLDALTCASVYSGDRGRYLTEADVALGYAEPEESPAGVGAMRVLSATSGYPPRRDVAPLATDHADVARFADDALRIMPELDTVTMATPRAESEVSIVWEVPASWPAGPTTLSVEANAEGDYGGGYDPSRYPTPALPDGAWDSWSQSYGYPYRGQPSVIFDLVVTMPPEEPTAPALVAATLPTRMGSLDASLTTRPLDDTIVNDPVGAPGSGVARLRTRADGHRVEVWVHVECE